LVFNVNLDLKNLFKLANIDINYIYTSENDIKNDILGQKNIFPHIIKIM